MDGAGERFQDAGDGATLSDPATEKPNAGATASSPSQGVRGFVKTKPPLKIYYCTHSGVLKRVVHPLSYRYSAPPGPIPEVLQIIPDVSGS